MGDREFKEMFTLAQKDKEIALEEIFEQFKLLLYKGSYAHGRFDEDCFQELSMSFFNCITRFKFKSGIGSAMLLKLIREHDLEI
jgi:hypothetical protein